MPYLDDSVGHFVVDAIVPQFLPKRIVGSLIYGFVEHFCKSRSIDQTNSE
jgi:hypothetical protein